MRGGILWFQFTGPNGAPGSATNGAIVRQHPYVWLALGLLADLKLPLIE